MISFNTVNFAAVRSVGRNFQNRAAQNAVSFCGGADSFERRHSFALPKVVEEIRGRANSFEREAHKTQSVILKEIETFKAEACKDFDYINDLYDNGGIDLDVRCAAEIKKCPPPEGRTGRFEVMKEFAPDGAVLRESYFQNGRLYNVLEFDKSNPRLLRSKAAFQKNGALFSFEKHTRNQSRYLQMERGKEGIIKKYTATKTGHGSKFVSTKSYTHEGFGLHNYFYKEEAPEYTMKMHLLGSNITSCIKTNADYNDKFASFEKGKITDYIETDSKFNTRKAVFEADKPVKYTEEGPTHKVLKEFRLVSGVWCDYSPS